MPRRFASSPAGVVAAIIAHRNGPPAKEDGEVALGDFPLSDIAF
jgi:hypothetical protein